MNKARWIALTVGLVATLAVLVTLLVTSVSSAVDALYTFEMPQFALGDTTPMINIVPNSGPATFATSFRDAATPAASSFTIDSSATNQPNNLMMGQFLFEPTTTSALALTFNAPVTGLSVNFAINADNESPPGLLKLTTPSGGVDQAGSNVGGTFQGGTLSFSSGSPFTSASLQGFSGGGTDPSHPTQIAIDNLDLTLAAAPTVPDPSSLTLLSVGGLSLAVAAWRRSRT